MAIYGISSNFTAVAARTPASFSLSAPAYEGDERVKCVGDICKHLRNLAGIGSDTAVPRLKEADKVIDKLVQECTKRDREFFSYDGCTGVASDSRGYSQNTYVDITEWARKLYRQGYRV
jgi:hypothetical protein